MTEIGDAPRTLDIGRVIQQLFGVLGRNFVTFLLLAVVMTGIPTAVIYGLQGNIVNSAVSGVAFGPALYWSALGGLVAGVSSLILQGAIIHGTVSDLNGRPVSVGAGLATGLRAFLPLFGIAILFGIAVALASVLLLVPGIMLAVAWCVAVPTYVIEQPGVFGSFRRSAELTRGSRWSIFGLFVIYLVAVIIIEVVLGVFGGIANFATIGGFPLITRLVVLPLIQVVNALIGATGIAVLYVDLRRVRDGVGPQSLAAVFD